MTDTRTDPPMSYPPARILRMEDAEDEDLSVSTTVQERVAMVAILSRRMWEISGRAMPSYPRSEIPVRVLRPE